MSSQPSLPLIAAFVGLVVAVGSGCAGTNDGIPAGATNAWDLLQIHADYDVPKTTGELIAGTPATHLLQGVTIAVRPGRVLSYGPDGKDGVLHTAFLEVRTERAAGRSGELLNHDTVVVEVEAPPQIQTSFEDFRTARFSDEPTIFLVTADTSTLASSWQYLEPDRAPKGWFRAMHPMAVLQMEPDGRLADSAMTDDVISVPVNDAEGLFDVMAPAFDQAGE